MHVVTCCRMWHQLLFTPSALRSHGLIKIVHTGRRHVMVSVPVPYSEVPHSILGICT
jgi:hypothetical protein